MRLWGCGEILREEPSRLKMELFLYVLRLDLKCSIVDLKVPCSDFGRRSGGVHSFSANVGSSRPSSPLCSTNLIVAIPVLQQAHGCGSKHVETELCNSHVHKVGGFSPRNDTEHLSLQNNLFSPPPNVLPCFTNFFTHILADLHPKQIQDPRLSCRLHPPRQLGGCRPGSRWGAGGGRARAHRGAPEAAASELSHGRPGEVPWGPVAGGDGDGKKEDEFGLEDSCSNGMLLDVTLKNQSTTSDNNFTRSLDNISNSRIELRSFGLFFQLDPPTSTRCVWRATSGTSSSALRT